MNFLLITIALFLSATLQAKLPTLWWLGGIRLEFLPAFVAFAALTCKRGTAFMLALAAGFLQDALSAGPFGLTAIVYGALALLIARVCTVLDRDLPFVQMGSGALITATASLAACIAVGFPHGALLKILVLTTIASLLTPVLVFVFDFVRYSVRSRA